MNAPNGNHSGNSSPDYVDTAARIFGVTRTAIMSPARDERVCQARFAVMKALRDDGLSYPRIAPHVGRSDHTTIIHGVSRAEELIEQDEAFAEAVSRISALDPDYSYRPKWFVEREKAAAEARAKDARDRAARQERAAKFAAQRRGGATFQLIANRNGITAERVRQVLVDQGFDSDGTPLSEAARPASAALFDKAALLRWIRCLDDCGVISLRSINPEIRLLRQAGLVNGTIKCLTLTRLGQRIADAARAGA